MERASGLHFVEGCPPIEPNLNVDLNLDKVLKLVKDFIDHFDALSENDLFYEAKAQARSVQSFFIDVKPSLEERQDLIKKELTERITFNIQDSLCSALNLSSFEDDNANALDGNCSNCEIECQIVEELIIKLNKSLSDLTYYESILRKRSRKSASATIIPQIDRKNINDSVEDKISSEELSLCEAYVAPDEILEAVVTGEDEQNLAETTYEDDQEMREQVFMREQNKRVLVELRPILVRRKEEFEFKVNPDKLKTVVHDHCGNITDFDSAQDDSSSEILAPIPAPRKFLPRKESPTLLNDSNESMNISHRIDHSNRDYSGGTLSNGNLSAKVSGVNEEINFETKSQNRRDEDDQTATVPETKFPFQQVSEFFACWY